MTGTVFTTVSIKLADPILASVLTPVVEIVLGYIIQTTVMGEVNFYCFFNVHTVVYNQFFQTPCALAISGASVVIASVVGITLEKQGVARIPQRYRNYF